MKCLLPETFPEGISTVRTLKLPDTKGHDLFDLVWYLSGRIWPDLNLALLNSALNQTGWSADDTRELEISPARPPFPAGLGCRTR